MQETANVEICDVHSNVLRYADAMAKYGSDKPDLRFGLELEDVSDIVADSGVQVFANRH